MKMTVDIKPFSVPNFVLSKVQRLNTDEASVQWPLRGVPPEILSAMCNEFRAEIFKKAKKSDPLKEITDGD